jgi:hypothetical protein
MAGKTSKRTGMGKPVHLKTGQTTKAMQGSSGKRGPASTAKLETDAPNPFVQRAAKARASMKGSC